MTAVPTPEEEVGKAESTGSPCERLSLSSFRPGESDAGSHTLGEWWETGFHHPFQTVLRGQEKLKTPGRTSGLEKLEETTNENYKEKRKTETFKMKLVKCTRNLSYHSPTKNRTEKNFRQGFCRAVLTLSEAGLCRQDPDEYGRLSVGLFTSLVL